MNDQVQERLIMAPVTWSQITSETKGFRDGFVDTFLKYRGHPILDDNGDPLSYNNSRPVLVNQSNFVEQHGLTRSTFKDWLAKRGEGGSLKHPEKLAPMGPTSPAATRETPAYKVDGLDSKGRRIVPSEAPVTKPTIVADPPADADIDALLDVPKTEPGPNAPLPNADIIPDTPRRRAQDAADAATKDLAEAARRVMETIAGGSVHTRKRLAVTIGYLRSEVWPAAVRAHGDKHEKRALDKNERPGLTDLLAEIEELRPQDAAR